MRGICHGQESFSDARRSAHYHFMLIGIREEGMARKGEG
jgi:hypothetical protein